MTFHVKHLLLFILFLPFSIFAQKMATTTLEIKPNPIFPAKDLSIDSFLNEFEETKLLDPEQMEWFYWTNYSRKNPRRFWDSVVKPFLQIHPSLNTVNSVSLKNELYQTANLSLLKPSALLMKTAKDHAVTSASKKIQSSHISYNGSSFQDRMNKADIKYCAGENITFGPSNTPFALVLLYIDEGVSDLGHRKTLLDPAFVEMGIGVGHYPNNLVFIVQDFACKQTDANVSRETN